MGEGTPPARSMARRAAAAAPGLLVVVAVAALGGFVFVAVNVSYLDAVSYQPSGPLAGYSRELINDLLPAAFVLGALIFAGATLRFGLVGAFAALVGYGIVGLVLAEMSPLSQDPGPPGAPGYVYTGVRTSAFVVLPFVGIGLFVVVVPITLVARWISCHSRPAIG
jgi:hypothetical protein